MAGTIVADTLQDGSSNSTAMTNAIKGSAKAWVVFNGSTAVINASFNVSSITKNGTGNYTITFTTAMPDAYFVTNFNYVQYQYNMPTLQGSQTTTTVGISTMNQFSSSTSAIDSSLVGCVINR